MDIIPPLHFMQHISLIKWITFFQDQLQFSLILIAMFTYDDDDWLKIVEEGEERGKGKRTNWVWLFTSSMQQRGEGNIMNLPFCQPCCLTAQRWWTFCDATQLNLNVISHAAHDALEQKGKSDFSPSFAWSQCHVRVVLGRSNFASKTNHREGWQLPAGKTSWSMTKSSLKLVLSSSLLSSQSLLELTCLTTERLQISKR